MLGGIQPHTRRAQLAEPVQEVRLLLRQAHCGGQLHAQQTGKAKLLMRTLEPNGCVCIMLGEDDMHVGSRQYLCLP